MFPYFDAHCDTIYEIARQGCTLLKNDLHIDLTRLSGFSPAVQTFALFSDMGEEMRNSCRSEEEFITRVKAGEVTESPAITAEYRKLISVFRRELAANADRVVHCRSAAEIEAAHRAGKLAAILAVEGAEQLYDIPLREAYADGVRIVTLTWNYENSLGGSCITGGGLTEKGRDFVREANELGILLDVSHGSDALFRDVAELSAKPFIASHSNARAVHAHRRNLTDEQFLAICRAGGVAGINLFADFLTDGSCTISHVVRHIEHFLSLGGAKHIALGGDLDGCGRLPAGISGVQDLPRIPEELARLGYSDELIHDLLYHNLFRAFAAATA